MYSIDDGYLPNACKSKTIHYPGLAGCCHGNYEEAKDAGYNVTPRLYQNALKEEAAEGKR